ncbi:FAD/NAD(P)-binding protein [Nonomuraea sp. NPDC003214]
MGPGQVTVVELSAHLWRGRPYGPDLDSVLVNAPPAIKSLHHPDCGHYASRLGPERAATHRDDLLGQPLVPHAPYGEYLADTAEAALAALRERGLGHGTWLPGSSRWPAPAATPSSRCVPRTGATIGPTGWCCACVGGRRRTTTVWVARPGSWEDPYPLGHTVGRAPAAADVAVIAAADRRGRSGVARRARSRGPDHAGVARRHAAPRLAESPRSPAPACDRRAGGGAVPRAWRPHPRRPHRAAPSRTGRDGRGLDGLHGRMLAARAEKPVRRWRRQLAAVGDPRTGRRVLQESAHTVGPYAWRLLSSPTANGCDATSAWPRPWCRCTPRRCCGCCSRGSSPWWRAYARSRRWREGTGSGATMVAWTPAPWSTP